jgi:hypothetical protein
LLVHRAHGGRHPQPALSGSAAAFDVSSPLDTLCRVGDTPIARSSFTRLSLASSMSGNQGIRAPPEQNWNPGGGPAISVLSF